MQELPLIPLNWRTFALYLIAAILGSGTIAALVTSWIERRKRRADLAQTDAATTEIRIRTKLTEVDAIGKYRSMLTETQEQVDRLRDENLELESRCLDLLVAKKQADTDLAQANTTIGLNEQFIARLHAATKLGMELKDLPPTIRDIIEMLEALEQTVRMK